MQSILSAKPGQVSVASYLPSWRVVLVAVLFIVAFGIRLNEVNEPPLSFHATRQYRSLIIARGLYYELTPSISDEARHVAVVSKARQGVLEPPVMELIVATGYRVLGGEHYWVPHVLASLFWLIGGCFLFRISRQIAGGNAAIVSTAVYLLLPFAVVASRSFQPDPLMVMLLLASIDAIYRYHARPSLRRFVIAALIAALAIFIKPVSLFAILGAYASLACCGTGVLRAVTTRRNVIFVALTLVPVTGFYVYGLLLTDNLQEQARASFLPRLLLDPFYWRGWLRNVNVVVGLPLLAVALLSAWRFSPGRPRALMLGLWVGYGAFCLVFNYHIATHDYYHLQLVPIVALSVGLVGAAVVEHLAHRQPHLFWRSALLAIGLLALFADLRVAHGRLEGPDAQHQVAVAAEVGDLVGHTTDAVYLSADYGLTLEYHGLLSGRPWPLASDLDWERRAGVRVLGAEERFEDWFAGDAPRYFIVMDMRELEQQPDLERLLNDRFRVLAASSEYVIFDLQ